MVGFTQSPTCAGRRESNLCYYVAASRLGIAHALVLHRGEKDDGNYTVDAGELAAALRRVLAPRVSGFLFAAAE